MANEQKRRNIDSLSGVVSPKNQKFSRDKRGRIIPKKESYLGIEPLPQEPKKDPKVVSFELKVPKISIPKFPKVKKVKLSHWHIAVGIVSFVIVLGVLIGINPFKKSNQDNPTSEIQQAPPTFDTLAPETAKTEKPVSFDQQKSVASFNDKITGVDVTVSQQPLPDQFKAKPEEEVEKLARNLKANKIVYAGEVKAFSGTSSEDGSQTVVFNKKDLLIFIRAKKELDKDGLVQYIINLN